jgi:hypothetical protein
MAKLEKAKSITVVYEFTDTEELEKKSAEIRKLFLEEEGAPIRITGSGIGDEMSIVELLSFAIEIEDRDFARDVQDRKNLSDLLDVMQKSTAYSDENGVSLSDAYDAVCPG